MKSRFSHILAQDGHWQHGSGNDGDDYTRLMTEIDFLLENEFPLGVALMVGEMDERFHREVGRIVGDHANEVSWVVSGPFIVVMFHQRLFGKLQSIWLLIADSVDAACGVAFSDGFGNHTEILHAARIALQRAMAQSLNLLVLRPEEAALAVADHAIGATMKKSLAAGSGDFQAYFQPQVFINSGLPCGAEALARWRPDDTDIPPSRFIPIAEEVGLIGAIGEMMFVRSARAIKVMRRSGIEIPYIAVNVSPLQRRQGNLIKSILEILRDEKLSPSDIEIEITESLVGNGGEEFLRWLADLSSAGFHIAVDDFGTGASSLARICEVPAHKIKLDRNFIGSLPHDVSARAVCRSALDMLHSLGKKSLAEGVELAAQATYLGALDCAMGQGFYWGRPMAEGELINWWKGARTECAILEAGLTT